jgi:hypothetical protein
MTVEQIIEIPANRRITLEVPPAVPAGRTILTFTPATERQDKPAQKTGNNQDTPRADRLLGIAAHLGDISLEEIREERLAKYIK